MPFAAAQECGDDLMRSLHGRRDSLPVGVERKWQVVRLNGAFDPIASLLVSIEAKDAMVVMGCFPDAAESPCRLSPRGSSRPIAVSGFSDMGYQWPQAMSSSEGSLRGYRSRSSRHECPRRPATESVILGEHNERRLTAVGLTPLSMGL